MQQARTHNRAPGSFSPLTSTNTNSSSSSSTIPHSRPPPIKTNAPPRPSYTNDEATTPTGATLSRPRSRNPASSSPRLSPGLSPSSRTTSPGLYQSSIFAGSNSSLVNNPRTYPASSSSASTTAAVIAARAGSLAVGASVAEGGRGPSSPLASSPSIASTTTTSSSKGHHRKHSQTPGLFEPTLPSTSTSNLLQHQQPQPHQQQQLQHQLHQQHPHPHQNSANPVANPNPNPTALAAAAQAAMQHQNHHLRQRSQTVPTPGADTLSPPYDPSQKPRGASTSAGKGPLSPPMLSLTEASAPRETGFGNQAYHNGLMGNHTVAATTAANVVFQRPNVGGGQPSPSLPNQTSAPAQLMSERDREVKTKPEKSRKLFGRPSKISVKGDMKEKPQPSPSKIGAAFSSLQRGNFSSTSLVDPTAPSLYTLANSSSATIRAVEASIEKEGKEKKHHFLSRGKHKLSNKDSDYHSILSSSSSNSKPTGPHAPSIYNFNVPSSPGPTTTSFKSGLDLRHGGRRDKKSKEDKSDSRDYDAGSIHSLEWAGPSSLGSVSGQNSMYLPEPLDPTKFGLNNMTLDDAWPYLKAKLLVIFQGEDLRLPVEDFNRVVTMHIQYCIQRRAPHIILEDLNDLLTTGFASMDQALRSTSEDRLIPDLVERWLFTFTGIVPYMQAVFLPLDLEFSGNGNLLSAEKAREFWGGVTTWMTSGGTGRTSTSSPTERYPPHGYGHGHGHGNGQGSGHGHQASTASTNSNNNNNVLDLRRLVLAAYRDAVILPRYDTLRQIFSRLSLEFLPMVLQSAAQAGPIPIAGSGGGGGGANNNASASSSFVDGNHHQHLLSSSPALSEVAGVGVGVGAVPHATGSFSSIGPRPGTAMSLDPSLASYNSTGTTLLGEGGGANPSVGPGVSAIAAMAGMAGLPGGSNMSGGGGGGVAQILAMSGSRSRAISNVSFGSNLSAERPYTPSGGGGGGSSGVGGGGVGARDNVEDSKQVTEMVGRMLQCMSVLAGVGVAGVGEEEEGNAKIGELCRLLKLNWLGRGRTGRNRRGIVGGRVRKELERERGMMGNGGEGVGGGGGGVVVGGGSRLGVWE